MQFIYGSFLVAFDVNGQMENINNSVIEKNNIFNFGVMHLSIQTNG